MSGGNLCDYAQYRINDIVEAIEEQIARNKRKPEDEYDTFFYTKETIREFEEAIKILEKAAVYAQRIDWLVSGDDSEESFHKRLKEEIVELQSK